MNNWITGKNGAIMFDGVFVWLRKSGGGFGTFVNQGIQGDRYIIARSITAVEFYDGQAGSGNGFISFDFPGKNPPRGGVFDAMGDENAVIFTAQQLPAFTTVRDEILRFLWGLHRQQPADLDESLTGSFETELSKERDDEWKMSPSTREALRTTDNWDKNNWKKPR